MNYTEMESKVREATNEEPWGPTGQIMQELAQATFSYEYFPEVMAMLWRRMLIDNQGNWRRTYKSLVVLNYLVKNGAERVVTSAREHIYDLKSLENYSYTDETGKDCGVNVRLRVKQLIEFIQDDDVLREERKKAKQNRDKYIGVSSDGTMSGKGGLRFNNSFSDNVRNEDEFTGESNRTTIDKRSCDARRPAEFKDEIKSDKAASPPSKADVGPVKSTRDQKKPTNFDLMSSDAVLDVFGGLESTNDVAHVAESKSVHKQAGTSPRSNGDADLRSCVQNIDIFSNKRPRPPKSNKSDIPDLTKRNPNLATTSGQKRSGSTAGQSEKLSVPIVQKRGNISNNSTERSRTKPDSIFANESDESVPAAACQQTASVMPIDKFDLLSINTVPSQSQQKTSSPNSNNIPAKSQPIQKMQSGSTAAKSSALDELATMVSDDDPFGFGQLSSDKGNTATSTSLMDNLMTPLSSGASNPAATLNSVPSNLLGPTPVTPEQKTASTTKLPDTWNSLLSGTKFNIDLDNLLKPDSGKGSAPSLNQLATRNSAVKPSNNLDDLLG